MKEKFFNMAYAVCAALMLPIAVCAVALPGEGGTKPALGHYPFPDRMSAYVWRNWGFVPAERLAETVGATRAELAGAAAEMGLKGPVAVQPEWRRKGYITVLRRNWHILPYSQLTRLLDMTREELVFALKEDDFLWHKLGSVKPACEPLKWTPPDEKTRAARRRIAEILKEEGIDPNAPEEPRFSFIADLKTPLKTEPLRFDGAAFDIRLIFSYFADYGDPLAEAEVGSYPEGLLDRLAARGVNAVWLHTVLSTLAADPKYPEFGKGSEKRIANLKTLVARAAKRRIKVFLYMNEPRYQPGTFYDARPERAEMQGVPERDGLGYAMCTSCPETRRWLRDAVKQVFASAPGLGGIFTITSSENQTSCASHWTQNKCERCRKRKRTEIIAEVNATMVEGMLAGNPEAQAVVWDWGWGAAAFPEIVRMLPRDGVRLMSVSERGQRIERGGIKTEVGEYSVTAPGPSADAKAAWGVARNLGAKTMAKVQANSSWELSPFPYLPVFDLVAEHAERIAAEGVDGVMMSWSIGCYPAPNLSVFGRWKKGDSKDATLDALAEELYGKPAARAVREAWRAFANGAREYPFDIRVVYNGPQQWGPANPLYPEKTGWTATMVGFPYDDVKRWCGPYPAENWIAQMRKVERGFAVGCALFEKSIAAMPAERKSAAEKELAMFRAEMLHFRSSATQAEFILARDRKDASAAKALAAKELATAKEYLPLVRADSRVGYECSNHYFFTPRDVIEKLLGCRGIVGEI